MKEKNQKKTAEIAFGISMIIFLFSALSFDALTSQAEEKPVIMADASKNAQSAEALIDREAIQKIIQLNSDQLFSFYQVKAKSGKDTISVKAYFEPKNGLTVTIILDIKTKKMLFFSKGIKYELKITDNPPEYGNVDQATFSFKDNQEEENNTEMKKTFSDFPPPMRQELERIYGLVIDYASGKAKTPTAPRLIELFNLEEFYQTHI